MSALQTQDNVVQLIPAGKIRCYITGKLRPDKPEENVRQRWARSLVEEYRYRRDDMAVEFQVKRLTRNGPRTIDRVISKR